MPRVLFTTPLVLMLVIVAPAMTTSTAAGQESPSEATLSLPPMHNAGGLAVLVDDRPCLFVALTGPLRVETQLGGSQQPEWCSNGGGEVSFVGADGHALGVRLPNSLGSVVRLSTWPPEPAHHAPPEHPELGRQVTALIQCYGLALDFSSDLVLVADANGTFPACPEDRGDPEARIDVLSSACPARVRLVGRFWPSGIDARIRVHDLAAGTVVARRTGEHGTGIIQSTFEVSCRAPTRYRLDVYLPDGSGSFDPESPLVSRTFDVISAPRPIPPQADPLARPIIDGQGRTGLGPFEVTTEPPGSAFEIGGAATGTIVTDTVPADTPSAAPRTDITTAARNVAASVAASVVLALVAAAAVEVAARRRGRS